MIAQIRKSTILALSLGFAFLASAQDAKPQPAKTTRALKINLSYTGAGAVDEKHPIFIFLFDTPDFMKGEGMPIDSKSASAKTGPVNFGEVTASPVYIAVVYDPTGGYDGQSPPPSGSSTAIYSKTPGVPEPVKIDAGGMAEVAVTFDDTNKMP